MSRVEPGKQRATLLLLVFVSAALLIVGRSGYIQLMDQERFEQQFVEKSFLQEELVPARRGMFLDRNGSPVAASSPLYLIAIDPVQMNKSLLSTLRKDDANKARSAEALQAQADQLATKNIASLADVFNLNHADLTTKYTSYYRNNKQYLVVAREATPSQAIAVQSIVPTSALIQSARYQRQYPDAEVIGGLIGYTHKQNENEQTDHKILQEYGVEGLEKIYEPTLAGVPRRVRMIVASDGKSLEELEVLEERQDGADIQLSIDRRVQTFAYEALRAGLRKNKAAAGSVVVMRPSTGEILALVNLPTINPNNITTNELKNRKDYSLVTPVEPGSVVKPLTVALGLETGVINENTGINTENGRLQVGQFTIKDVSRRDVLTPEGIIRHSSNIGAGKIANMIGAKAMHQWYQRLGFGERTALGYPGESRGYLRPAKEWYESGLYTHGYGYGFQVNMVQLLKSFTTLANDGVLVEPSLLKRNEPAKQTPLLTPSTAASVRKMMMSVVESEDAGARTARVPGFNVAGKTGTVHVVKNGVYQEGQYRSLFLGMLPAESPEIMAIVMVDRPTAVDSDGERIRYGSSVAAPIFGELMKDTVRVLGIMPTKYETVMTADASEAQ